jgi:hypothetical protein
VSAEKSALLAYLGDQRRHVLGILEGVADADLRRPLLPTGWSCLAMVKHLALDVERFWFPGIVGGDASVVTELGKDPDGAWRIGPDDTAEQIFALYRRECARADEAIARADLDAGPGYWPDGLFGDWRPESVRRTILHALAETATHAGHLDITRELIDGRTWLILTGQS